MSSRFSFAAAALSVLALTACGQTEPAPDASDADAASSASAVSSAASAAAVSSEDISSAAPAPAAQGEPRVIQITADNWDFSPATIIAKRGEKITLQITGKAGIHGFAVPALGINESVSPGEVITVELPTDAAGVYDAFCSIPCGEGHRAMKATVVIEE